MSFEKIIGNQNAKNILTNAVKMKNILQSYIFSGPEGIGKKLFAKEFAKMILCLDEKDKPCDKCKSCVEFESSNNPDFSIIHKERKDKN